jgi:hypothetical protein
MPFNIVDAVHNRVSDDVVANVAGWSGETPARARSAMFAGAFATAVGLIRRGATAEGAAGLLSGLRGGPPGIGLLGERTDDLVDVVASSSGVSHGSAVIAMAAIAPLAAGALDHEALSHDLDASGLSSMLLGQRRALLGAAGLPAGLSGILGSIGGEARSPEARLRADVRVPIQPRERRATRARPPRGRGALLVFVLLAIGALLLAASLFFVCGKRTTVSLPPDPPSVGVARNA